MAAPTASDIVPILKRYLHGQKAEVLIEREHTLAGLFKKDPDFGGEDEPFPVVYKSGVGVSGSHANANTYADGHASVNFHLTNGRLYGTVPFDDEALMRARKNFHRFIELKMLETDAVRDYMMSQLNNQLAQGGGGSLGTISGLNTGTDVFTVQNMNLFEKGQELVFSNNDGSLTSHALVTAQLKVATLDRNTGVIGYTVTSGADTNVTNADHAFLVGTFGGATAANNSKPIKGLGAWHPGTVTSDAFFGVDRTPDTRLTGAYWSSSALNWGGGGTNLTRVKNAANHANKNFGAKPRTCVVNPDKFLDITKELENAGPVREFTRKSESGYTGYSAIQVVTSYGPIDLMSDADVVTTDGWLINPKVCMIKSMGPMIHVIDRDGNQMRMAAPTAEIPQFAMQLAAYCQFAVAKPSDNCRIVMES